MDSVIKAVLDDLRARGEPTTAEAVAERLFVLSVLNVDEVTPDHDAYIERMLPPSPAHRSAPTHAQS